MSLPFKYTINQAKECINKTEEQLRDLISTILSAKYGIGWENSSSVWDELTRQELEKRRDEEKNLFRNQQVSDRLLDYCDIKHLKNLIQSEWSLFESIFLSEHKTMMLFDILQTLRNPQMHSRPSLLPHQRHLCLGICGEFLQAIEKWRRGYRHKVKQYTIVLKFPAYPKGEDEGTALVSARQIAEEWLFNVVSRANGKLDEKPIDEDKRSYLLRIHEGHIKVTMDWDYHGYDGYRNFRATDITMTAVSLPALKKIVEIGAYPYWYISWTLKEDLDASIIVSRVAELTGNQPDNSVSIHVSSVSSVIQNASFRIDKIGQDSIKANLFRARQNLDAEINLIFDGIPGVGGFYQAHNVFSVEKILSILYGELTPMKVHELVKEACTL